MEASYTLSRDLVFCRVDEGVIFLNLKTERYFGLGQAQFEWVRKHLDGAPLIPNRTVEAPSQIADRDDAMLKDLVAKGVLVRGDGLGYSSVPPVRHAVAENPSESLMNYGTWKLGSRIRPYEVAAFGWAVLRAWMELRTLKLRGTVRSLQRRNATMDGKRSSTVPAQHLVAVFLRLRPWFYTARDRCLFDSLVLVEFLYKFDVPASYVIGVTSKPFSAHCWVQYGSVVLNDDLERVAQFAPILSV